MAHINMCSYLLTHMKTQYICSDDIMWLKHLSTPAVTMLLRRRVYKKVYYFLSQYSWYVSLQYRRLARLPSFTEVILMNLFQGLEWYTDNFIFRVQTHRLRFAKLHLLLLIDTEHPHQIYQFSTNNKTKYDILCWNKVAVSTFIKKYIFSFNIHHQFMYILN